MLFNSTALLIDAFVAKIRDGYRRTYGGWKSQYSEILAWAGSMALENIANSDALYHTVDHTIWVTLTGQEIIRGKHIREGGVSPEDWLHYIISLLFHDIGYVKGVCTGDRDGHYATGLGDGVARLPFGATDASLMPYHVDRSKRFVEERFGGHQLIDVDILKRNIEATRFPIPTDAPLGDPGDYPALVRAADFLGPLSDPGHLHRLAALFYEMEETGAARSRGYYSPADLRDHFLDTFWSAIEPHTRPARRYLELTQQGKQIIANLHANLFTIEHGSRQGRLGQSSGGSALGTGSPSSAGGHPDPALPQGTEEGAGGGGGSSLQESAARVARLLSQRKRQAELPTSIS